MHLIMVMEAHKQIRIADTNCKDEEIDTDRGAVHLVNDYPLNVNFIILKHKATYQDLETARITRDVVVQRRAQF